MSLRKLMYFEPLTYFGKVRILRVKLANMPSSCISSRIRSILADRGNLSS